MNDDRKNDTTPVIVKAMNVRWFGREEGKLFLEEILKTNDLSLFKHETIQILVEYFFQKYKGFLFSTDLPLFMGKVVFFYAQMLSNESLTYE